MPSAGHHLSTQAWAFGTRRLVLFGSFYTAFSSPAQHTVSEMWHFIMDNGITVVFLIILVILGLMYSWKKRNVYSYWTKQNVPQLDWNFFVGSYELHKTQPLFETELVFYKHYGRVYGRYDGFIPVLTVGDPELLKRILVKDFNLFMNRRDMRCNSPVMDNTLFTLDGSEWKRVRKIVSPTLTSSKLKRMLPLLQDCSDVLIENIDKMLKENKNIDCQRFFGGFVIDAIARCAFGISINSIEKEDHPFVQKANKLLDCNFGWKTTIIMTCPILLKIFRIELLNPETTQFYKRVILKVLEDRKYIVNREDFLQILCDSQNDLQDQNNNSVKEPPNGERPSGTDAPQQPIKGLSRNELVAQCITFFTAGYDSTTSLLSHAIYNLAMHQDHQDRVVAELQDVLKVCNGDLNYESLSELKFMEAVLNECLRLCPPMVRSERRVEKDCHLGDTNIRLKKGMLISIPVFALHRDPEFFPDPNTFKPERFYGADPDRPQYVHLPFGEGPRKCIAFRFVLMQVKLCLAKVLLRYRVLPASTTPKQLGLTETRNVLKVQQVEVAMEERR